MTRKERKEMNTEERHSCLIIGEMFNLPKGFVLKDENGNVINATKIVLEKKDNGYPKTYEECCEILGLPDVVLYFNADYYSFDASKDQWERLGLMNQFYQLLICRDAYWKIAGEATFRKPWEPDWKNHNIKYVLYNQEGAIDSMNTSGPRNYILAFQTPEMRDAFKENFKELIESCKELL